MGPLQESPGPYTCWGRAHRPYHHPPPPPPCQDGKFMASTLAQVNKLLLPFLAPRAPARSLLLTLQKWALMQERERGVCVWGVVISHPLHTAKVKEIPLPEREGQTGEEFKGSKAQFHLCWLQNTQTKVPNLFQKGGGGRNLAAVVPLALAAMFPWKWGEAGCCWLSPPGRMAGQAFSKHIPFHFYPAQTTVPRRPPSSLPVPLPSLLELVSCQLHSRHGCWCPCSSQVSLARAIIWMSSKLRSCPGSCPCR